MATGMERAEPPLIVIIGPTASGKTALAIELAEQMSGEIICADSRTVYRDMDIGTAKPTAAERLRVPHWGLDLVDPSEKFTVSDFKKYANEKIADVRARGKVPLLVGGSGLYVNSVIFDYQLGLKSDESKRKSLEQLSLEQLHDYCKKSNIPLPENKQNKRYVVRAIERHGQNVRGDTKLIPNCYIVGIATERTVLRRRIGDRSEQIFTQPVVEEARILGKKYGWEHESMTGNIYPLIQSYLDGNASLEETKERFTSLDWALAKRQLTWFRRNPHIVWHTKDDAKRYLQELLAAC